MLLHNNFILRYSLLSTFLCPQSSKLGSSLIYCSNKAAILILSALPIINFATPFDITELVMEGVRWCLLSLLVG